LKRKVCGKVRGVGEISFIDLYKTETLLGGGIYEEELMKINSHVAMKTRASTSNKERRLRRRWKRSDMHITYLRHRALLEKLPITQLLKIFLAFEGTRRFITVFTRALYWSLS
jgi:hypothetical protein